MASGTTGSPCGACKFLRRKCASDCIFAPYFSSEQGAARFAAIHKIFGASNVSKLLLHVPLPDRCEAVVTIAYEAQARMRDPVYGCVGHIFALQHQVASLQAQLMQVKAQLAHIMADSRSPENYCQGSIGVPLPQSYQFSHTMSPQSSLDNYIGDNSNGFLMQEMCFKDLDLPAETCPKKRTQHTDLGELQAIALRMMRD